MKYVKTSLMVVALFFSCLACTTAKIEQAKYINWLKEQSMLYHAATLARKLSGKGIQWRHPYALPQTEQLLKTASVWFTAYPSSFITREGETIIQAMGSEDMWKTFEKIGIRAMHTGPLKRAGGIEGYEYTPTVDGWFDRVSSLSGMTGNDIPDDDGLVRLGGLNHLLVLLIISEQRINRVADPVKPAVNRRGYHSRSYRKGS